MTHKATILGETELDTLRADLQRHASALARLQSELAASRLEVAGARGETVQFKGFLGRSQVATQDAHAHIAELRLHAADREAEIVRLHGELVALHAALANLGNDIGAMRTSLSWRISAPVRLLGRLLGRR